MHSYNPLKIVRIFRGIEGSHEFAHQAILTTLFLIKTNFHNVSSVVPLVSLIFSLWSLASRFINLDEPFLNDRADSVGIKWSIIKENGLIHAIKKELNVWYVCHSLFRIFEAIFSVVMLSLFWTQLGGLIFGIALGFCAAIVACGNVLCMTSLENRELGTVSIYTDFLKAFLTVSIWNTSALFELREKMKLQSDSCFVLAFGYFGFDHVYYV